MRLNPRIEMTGPDAGFDASRTDVLDLHGALDGRRLLDHPFYRRWERGEVSMAELADYAEQYRRFEACLPAFLTALVAELPEGSARDLVAANLADEEGDPVSHVELFERFATAVGARSGTDDTPASPATSALVDTYAASLEDGPVAALAGFVAYECQASEVARTKADGLRSHYGLDDFAVSFWEHHARVDVRHSEWAVRALNELSRSNDGIRQDQLRTAFLRGADAWWSFLDEREAAARARPIVDNQTECRLETVVDGERAELVYHLNGDRLTIVHTGVPEPVDGRGIGGMLVAAAVEKAAENGYTIVPDCPFAAFWLRKHPEASKRVPIDWPRHQ